MAQGGHQRPAPPAAPGWARDLRSDPDQPPEIRIGAGLAWLCLVTDPAPDELLTLLTDPAIRRYDDLLHPVPWLTWIDATGFGLRSCIDDMLTANSTRTAPEDPWAASLSG
ncbi:hypothetical protein [Kitasatospora sp. NPDC097691]|uniref:hypothetical protein n=1 Tax=Kitasatospora sp. NPDC097691 TaxID=3157231 RepID=UPI0033273CEF